MRCSTGFDLSSWNRGAEALARAARNVELDRATERWKLANHVAQEIDFDQVLLTRFAQAMWH